MKKFNFKSLLAMILALVLALLAFAGCGTNNDDDKNEPTETPTPTESSIPAETPAPTEEVSRPESALDNYVAFWNGNTNIYKSLAPQEFWDYLKAEEIFDVDDFITNKMSEAYSKQIEHFTSTFGENYQAIYEINSINNLSADEINQIAESLKNTYNISNESFTEAYFVDADISVVGDKNIDTDQDMFYLVKIDDKWYMYGNEFVVPNIMIWLQ